jgi:hypothetical protein
MTTNAGEPRASAQPSSHHAAEERSPFVPLLLLALTLTGWLAFQTVQLQREKSSLDTAYASQDKNVQESKKLRDALDTLARDTALLADKGNPSARLLVDELRKRGVTINPTASPPAAPK